MSSRTTSPRLSKRCLAAVSSHLRKADGFTLVESLVATLVLVVGLLGAFLLLDVTVRTSATTRAREGAVTLAREITEDARSIPFSQLSSSGLAGTLQQMPGLANNGSGSTWQIVRRGVTYTVTVSETSLNDTKDGTGSLAVKQVTANVQWTIGGQTRSVQEVATMTSAGQVLGLATSNLQMTTPPPASTQPTITDPTVTQLGFQVTAPAGTSAIVWTVDGVSQPWTSTSSGTTWTSSSWSISGFSDGTYQVGAQAENAQGVVGPAVTIPVTLLRSIPSPPNVTGYGFNNNLAGTASSAVAEIEWQRNPERNVTGYHLYNPSGALICTTTYAGFNSSCGAHAWCFSPTACIDLSPPAMTASNLTYKVAATYLDVHGQLQDGAPTSATLTGTPITTFTLAPTTQNIGTNCSGSPAQDLRTTYTLASDNTQAGGQPVFCSRSFTSGQTFESGGTATAYIANPGSSACPVMATLNVDGSSSGALTASATVPKGTGVTPYTFSFTSGQLLNMSAGDRFNLTFNMTGTGCGSGSSAPVLHYGGTTYPSQLATPATPLDVPTAPASLTVTPQPDGTAVLTWPQPTTGAAINFFRIYRGGQSYTNRVAEVVPTDCLSGMCSYSDTNRASAHTYYVTSVGDTNLGSDMAESLATGPVTG
jgi:Tfp pilus assembly protein PilV